MVVNSTASVRFDLFPGSDNSQVVHVSENMAMHRRIESLVRPLVE